MPGHTKAEKRRLLSSIQSKCNKLFLENIFSVKDCESIGKIVKRGQSKLK